MKPYTKNVPGILVNTYTTRQPDGSYETSTSSGWEPAAVSVTLTCDEPNTKGDSATPNAFSFEKTYLELGQGVLTDTYRSSGVTYSIVRSAGALNCGAGNLSALGADLSYNNALDKLYERVRGSLDLSVALFEAGQTYRMLRPLRAYTRWVTSISPKRWHSANLEWQYGWRPLAMDVYGTVEELSKRIPKLERIKVRSTTKYYKKRRANDKQSFTDYIQMESYRTEFGVLIEPSSDFVTSIGRFASLNPASIAYELMPYSFVIDWFLDVGNYLRGLETAALYGASFRGGYVTRTSRVENHAKKSGNGRSVGGSTLVGSVSGIYRRSSLRRTVLLGMPTPELPKMTLDLSSQRLINAASLLRNFIADEKTPVERNRRVTNARIDAQLRAFGRGPKTWSNRAGNDI